MGFRDKLLKDNQDCTSYKIITIGDPGVGKTSLLKKLKSNDFVEEISEEVKAQTDHFYFENKEIKCKLEIWDQGGSVVANATNVLFYRNTKAALVCFDLTNRESFENAK